MYLVIEDPSRGPNRSRAVRPFLPLTSDKVNIDNLTTDVPLAIEEHSMSRSLFQNSTHTSQERLSPALLCSEKRIECPIDRKYTSNHLDDVRGLSSEVYLSRFPHHLIPAYQSLPKTHVINTPSLKREKKPRSSSLFHIKDKQRQSHRTNHHHPTAVSLTKQHSRHTIDVQKSSRDHMLEDLDVVRAKHFR